MFLGTTLQFCLVTYAGKNLDICASLDKQIEKAKCVVCMKFSAG